MEFTFHRPGPPLDVFVESITCFSDYAPRHTRERLIPDGAATLIVDLGETPKRLFRGDYAPEHVAFRRAWISGMQLKPIVIEAQPFSALMVIRFQPGGAYPFLGHDLSALTNDVASFDAVVGTAADALRERVLEPRGGPARIAAAEVWLHERLAGFAIHPAVAHAASRLHQPGARIADIVEETGFTSRHVLTLFRRWIGVTPKQYARVARFQYLLHALAHNAPVDNNLEGRPLPRPDWAAVAADLCFSDQSHLSHEFTAFSGMTPGDYVAAYRGLANYLPITVEADRL
jgi:AraC-like DNA-binding protein